MVGDLTPPGYVVLGLIARHGAMTPYELKGKVEESIDTFWPIPHAQLYRVPARLAEMGLLYEEAEEGGRHRRVFHLTGDGRAELERWLADPDAADPETRDPAQLKLYFSDLGEPGDVVALARARAERHRHWRDVYAARREALGPEDVSRARLLKLGMMHEEAYVEFWERLAEEPDRLD